MDTDKLARRMVNRLTTQAAVTEPTLVINGEAYGVSRLKRMMEDGTLHTLDGHPTGTEVDLSKYLTPRHVMSGHLRVYRMAANLIEQVEQGSKRLVLIDVGDMDSDTPLPIVSLEAPSGYEPILIRLEYGSHLKSVHFSQKK
jgi:hypothetical protein